MIKIRNDDKIVYFDNDKIIATYYTKYDKLDINSHTGIRAYRSSTAKLIARNLDALCERQCPKCYSGEYYVSFMESNGEYIWICTYCKNKSPKSKTSPKEAYDRWWSDIKVDEVEFDGIGIYTAYEDIKYGDIVCLFKEDKNNLWKGVLLCDAVLPVKVMYPLENCTNMFNTSSLACISGEDIPKDAPCVISQKDDKLYMVDETNAVSTLDGEDE